MKHSTKGWIWFHVVVFLTALNYGFYFFGSRKIFSLVSAVFTTLLLPIILRNILKTVHNERRYGR